MAWLLLNESHVKGLTAKSKTQVYREDIMSRFWAKLGIGVQLLFRTLLRHSLQIAAFISLGIISIFPSQSSARAELGISSLAQQLIGTKLPYDGPNCVNAAFIAVGLTDAIMHLDPSYSQRELVQKCLRPASGDDAKIGVIYTGDSLLHMYYLDPRSRKVFTKNGLDRGAGYQIQTEAEVVRQYSNPTAKTLYFEPVFSEACPLLTFQENLKNNNHFLKIKNEINQRVLEKNWNGSRSVEDYDLVRKEIQNIQAKNEIDSELKQSLLESYLSSPMFKDAAIKSERAHFETSTLRSTGLSIEAIRKRLTDIAMVNRKISTVHSDPALSGTLFSEILRKKKVQLSYWPSSKADINSIGVSVYFPLSSSENVYGILDRLRAELLHSPAFKIDRGDFSLSLDTEHVLMVSVGGIDYRVHNIGPTDKP
jgi:hypothetical protein